MSQTRTLDGAAAAARPTAELRVLPPMFEESTVARYLEVSVRTLQRARKRGEIQFHRIGHRAKYTLDDVLLLLDQTVCNRKTVSPTESPTSTPSSSAPVPTSSTSNGGRKDVLCGALLAIQALSQPSSAPAT